MVEFEVPEVDFTRYTNRQLAAIPVVVLAVALLVIAGTFVMTGAPVRLGIEFTGGSEVIVQTDASQAQVQQSLDFADSVTPVQTGDTYIVTTQRTDTGTLEQSVQDAGYDVQSIQSRSASFAANSQQTAIFGLVVAFVGMSALVFALFRSFVPSIAVVLSAFSDIMIPVALMNLFGIQLTLGTVAALLMLIGYSVDSDILLNNHVLRRRGGFYESAYRAMRTGVTMTVTSIAAMVVMTIAATLLGIPLLPEIGLVLVLGLSADLMNTYLLNMSLLRWYKYEGVAR